MWFGSRLCLPTGVLLFGRNFGNVRQPGQIVPLSSCVGALVGQVSMESCVPQCVATCLCIGVAGAAWCERSVVYCELLEKQYQPPDPGSETYASATTPGKTGPS